MIGLGAGLTIAPLVVFVLVIIVKRCRKKPEEETDADFAGDLNVDYGIYYSADGQRVEIESEARDVNPYYQIGEDIQLTVETKKTAKQPIPSSPPTPQHHKLTKDQTLQEKAKKMANDKVLLKSEFFRLEEFVKENIMKETTVAKLEENKAHNRYLDIGMYLQRLKMNCSSPFSCLR